MQRYVWLLFIIGLVACKPKSKPVPVFEKVKQSVANKIDIAKPDTEKVERAFPIDTIYPVLILTTNIFHNNEVDPKATKHRWKGIFKSDSGYYIADTELIILKCKDEVVDGAGQKTGWDVKATNKDVCILLVSETKYLENKSIISLDGEKEFLLPGEKTDYKFNGKEYALYATGVKNKIANEPGSYTISDYKLYLRTNISGKESKQLLISAPGTKEN